MERRFECCGNSTDSSSTNDSFPLVGFMFFDFCFRSITAVYVYIGYTLLHIVLLLPLSTSVLCWGFQQRKQQRSSAPVMSHFDFYTYIMAATELIGIFGAVLHIFSTFLHRVELMFWGIFIFSFSWGGQMLLPVMICLDRYQAVVFPISYVRLRQRGGLRLRNISTVVILALCTMNMFSVKVLIEHPQISVVPACASMLCVLTVCFCSVSVLCVLTRPAPGAQAVDRAQADPMKRKAFNTMVIIMGVLLFKFAGNLTCLMMSSSLQAGDTLQCIIQASQTFFNLPSSLVLPLLFLHRNRKLPGCRRTSESG